MTVVFLVPPPPRTFNTLWNPLFEVKHACKKPRKIVSVQGGSLGKVWCANPWAFSFAKYSAEHSNYIDVSQPPHQGDELKRR